MTVNLTYLCASCKNTRYIITVHDERYDKRRWQGTLFCAICDEDTTFGLREVQS